MKKSIYHFITSILLITMFTSQVKTENSDSSLYQKLGGQETIELITKNLLVRLFEDDRISFLFKDADKIDLHEKIVDQICMETGGPCQYEGLDMVETHGGFEIKYSEFDAFVEDFILALEDAEVPFRLQNQVLAIFAPMRDDITYK
jgi:hemoglobin